MWLLEKGGSGMNKYKLALDKLKNYSIGEVLRCEEILKERGRIGASA